MAKKIVYNIEIDSTDAQGSIKRVEERLNELNQTANASQKEINTLQQELKDLGQTRSDTAIEGIQSLRREYRRLTEELQRTEEGTEKFNELAQAAGQVRDRIDAANDSISNFNNSPFENIKSNLGQLAQKIRDLDFDGFKQSARDLGTNFANLGRSLIGLDKGLSVSAIGFRTLGVAIAATGVGALIAGISILIRNFDTLKSSGGLLGNSIKFLGELFTSFETSVLKLSDALGITANAYENFKKKQNEANQTTVKSAKEIEEEVQRLRKETYNAGLSDLEKALVAEREFRQKQFAVFIQDFRNQQARTAQERKELDEKAFIATEEFQKESERRLQKIRDDFAKEENKKAAEAAKKREQERIDALSKGFEDEKRLREKQFRNQQLIIGNLEYNAQIKLSEGLREARLNGVDIRQALSQILDQEFLDKQENVRLLYQTEYQYYSDLFDIKDKLEQQIIAEEKKLTKAPEQFDTLGFFGERPEYLVDLRNNLLTVQEDINKASSESVVRFVSLYSDRFNELVQTFQEPNLWQNIFVGYQDETEARFQATETTARQYIEKLKSILSGGEKGLFAEGLGTESEARKLIAGELAAAERVLADVQTKRLNRAEGEISVIDRIINQRRQLASTEEESLRIEIEGADKRIKLLEDYGLKSTDLYDEAIFQKKVAEKNLTDFLAQESEKRLNKEEQDNEKRKQDALSTASEVLNIAGTLTNGITNLVNQRYQNEIQRAGDNQEAIEQIQKEQFETNKALGIVTAIINTAQGITNALATSGPPWVGIAMAAVVGALGAAEVAMIASQEFTPGTSGGSSFTPNAQLSQSMGSVNAMQPNVNFAAAGSGANIQTAGGGSAQSVQFTGSISVSEINNTQNLVNIYETGSLLGSG